MRTVRIGAGAGYSGDRIEPAVELAEKGDLDYLVFECLAERTIALAQLARARDPEAGFDPLLVARMRAVLPACRRNGVRIITNMGAANPLAAARAVRQVARELGWSDITVAAVTGDDVLDLVMNGSYAVAETNEPVASWAPRLVSANAYVGGTAIATSLGLGANVVVTGRAADPALFLGPLAHEFGWGWDEWARLGAGTIVGHLLECAGQVTGGYFADPGRKDVPDLARLGFPLAEVQDDGTAVITKVTGSGGRVTRATCKEQLLYELHDPSNYITPDVVADFTGATLEDAGPDRVRVAGGSGRPKPPTLKVSLGYRDGFIGEGQISYAGAGALARGRLAAQIVRERLKIVGADIDEVSSDLIGVDAICGAGRSTGAEPSEVRLRVAGRAHTAADAERVGAEVESLYTNGPAGGAGATKSVREVLAIATTYVPGDLVTCHLSLKDEDA